MKQYSNRIYILIFIFLTMFASCTKNTDIEKTAVELFNEYKANPNDFTDYYKNKRILLTGTIVYASQNKHHPGDKYSILFNSGTENEESGIVCNFKSKTLGSSIVLAIFKTSSTKISVSGCGIRTSSFTKKFNPINS